MESILQDIRQTLNKNSDVRVQESSKRFFKEGERINLYGIKSAQINRISKDVFEDLKKWPKKNLYTLCEELWKSGMFEETILACNFSYYIRKQYEPSDWQVFSRWVAQYINNWATCDTFCNQTVGGLLMMFPDYIEKLKEWAISTNRWERRAAAVSLIIPARKGLFLKETFEITDLLLTDSENLVQKGYGWLLKTSSKLHCEEIFDYVMANKAIMPRTALRYAIEKMPAHLKAEAMKK